MPVSHKNKVIFVHIPKSAGKSINEALGIPFPGNKPEEKSYFAGPLSEEEKLMHGLGHHVWWGHLFASELKAFIPSNIFREYYKFAFVRNPWDRTVSYYMKHVIGNERFENNRSFENWILSHEFLNKKALWVEVLVPQVDYVLDNEGQRLVDFIGKFEDLEKDWKKIRRKIDIMADLPHINKSEHKHYSFYYNKKTEEIVADAFKKDIEMFGYKFEDNSKIIEKSKYLIVKFR